MIVDGAARAAALESGDVDLMYTIRAPDIEDFRENDEVTLIEDKQSEETYVQLNQADPAVRQHPRPTGGRLAIDSFVVAESLGEGITEPIDQPWAENDPYYNPEPGYVEFDVDAARRRSSSTGRTPARRSSPSS